jgi:DnaK suppressor protein
MHTHYSHEFLQSQEEALVAQKEQLVSELAKISRWDEASGTYIALTPNFEPGSHEDSGEDGNESEAGQTNTAITSDMEMSLADVNLALEKLAAGTYGLCESTGEWISEDRLKAYPAARTCNQEGLA